MASGRMGKFSQEPPDGLYEDVISALLDEKLTQLAAAGFQTPREAGQHRGIHPGAEADVLRPRLAGTERADEGDQGVDALVAAAEESKDRAPEPEAPAVDVARLFSALKVEKTKSGGLRIEAPPEAAATLAAVFQGFAQLLQAAAK